MVQQYKSDGKWLENKTFEELSKIFNTRDVIISPSKHLPTIFDTKQQVDASITGHPDFDFIIYECKDEGRIGVSASRQAEGIMKDVGATKAAIVGNGKYTAPLIKRCKHYGIDLLHLVDTNEARLRTSVTFDIITSFTWIEQYSYKAVFCGEEFEINIPPGEISSGYSSETIHEMVCSLWNENVLSKETGAHTYIRDKFELLAAPEHGLIRQIVDGIEIEYKVTRKFFLHKAPLADGSGVLDILNSKFTLTSPIISVGPMGLAQIVQLENEIDDTEFNQKSKKVGFVGEAYYVMQ